jgi:hypothetical protein
MAHASLNLYEIEDAQEYLLRAERRLQLDKKDVPCEGNFMPLCDEDIPDTLWLGAVALFVTEDGLDGNAIVVRNQDHILTARAAGFTVREIAEYAVLKERERLR